MTYYTQGKPYEPQFGDVVTETIPADRFINEDRILSFTFLVESEEGDYYGELDGDNIYWHERKFCELTGLSFESFTKLIEDADFDGEPACFDYSSISGSSAGMITIVLANGMQKSREAKKNETLPQFFLRVAIEAKLLLPPSND